MRQFHAFPSQGEYLANRHSSLNDSGQPRNRFLGQCRVFGQGTIEQSPSHHMSGNPTCQAVYFGASAGNAWSIGSSLPEAVTACKGTVVRVLGVASTVSAGTCSLLAWANCVAVSFG